MTVLYVNPKVRRRNHEEYERRQKEQRSLSESVRRTLSGLGRQDLVDELDLSRAEAERIGEGWWGPFIIVLVFLWLCS